MEVMWKANEEKSVNGHESLTFVVAMGNNNWELQMSLLGLHFLCK